uniref:Major facilitator superfamily (MFS) profile domain-containing protein n=1 Tax=Arion vulgaris TaxID=1028688 RepID=A0A0B7BI57_9EUPU
MAANTQGEIKPVVVDDSLVVDNQEQTRAMDIDSLLKNLGNCGNFQKIFCVLSYSPVLPAAWSLMFMTFGSYNPGWTCQDQSTSNSTGILQSLINMTISDELNLTMSACDTMRSCQNIVFNDIATTVVTEFTLICYQSWISPFIISIQMIGVTLGSVVGGQIGDKFGRKFSIYGCASLLVLTNIIAIFSVSWQMYTFIRLVIGFCAGSILATCAVYALELMPQLWRGVIGTLPIWSVATFSFGLCVLALKNWKYVHIATALFSFVTFLPVFWLPESLRFLTVHGKIQRGQKVVQKIARLNKRPLPDITIMSRIAEKEKEDRKNRSTYTYLDLFHRNIRRSSVVLGMSWFIFSIGYYMIGFGLNALSGDFFVNLLLYTAISFPSRTIAMFISAKFGIKFVVTTFICVASLCSFSVVAVQFLAPEYSKATLTLVMTFGSSMMMEGCWAALSTMVVELSPTPVRNLSYGFCTSLARIGSIIAPYMILREAIPLFGAFLLLGILQLVCVLGILTLPNTKGKPIPDNFLQKTTRSDTNNIIL